MEVGPERLAELIAGAGRHQGQAESVADPGLGRPVGIRDGADVPVPRVRRPHPAAARGARRARPAGQGDQPLRRQDRAGAGRRRHRRAAGRRWRCSRRSPAAPAARCCATASARCSRPARPAPATTAATAGLPATPATTWRWSGSATTRTSRPACTAPPARCGCGRDCSPDCRARRCRSTGQGHRVGLAGWRGIRHHRSRLPGRAPRRIRRRLPADRTQDLPAEQLAGLVPAGRRGEQPATPEAPPAQGDRQRAHASPSDAVAAAPRALDAHGRLRCFARVPGRLHVAAPVPGRADARRGHHAPAAAASLVQQVRAAGQLGDELDVQPLRDPQVEDLRNQRHARPSSAAITPQRSARCSTRPCSLTPEIPTCCSGRPNWRWSRATGRRPSSWRRVPIDKGPKARRLVPAQLDRRATTPPKPAATPPASRAGAAARGRVHGARRRSRDVADVRPADRTRAASGGRRRRSRRNCRGYVVRAAQQQLAEAVADAIDARATLIAEAGTGTGKTYAYLVPALLSGAGRSSPPAPARCRTSSTTATCRACATRSAPA